MAIQDEAEISGLLDDPANPDTFEESYRPAKVTGNFPFFWVLYGVAIKCSPRCGLFEAFFPRLSAGFSSQLSDDFTNGVSVCAPRQSMVIICGRMFRACITKE